MKTAFLSRNLEETICMDQPEGYIEEDRVNKFYLLEKALNGLKQARRQWYLRFDVFVIAQGFKRCSYDNFLYIKESDNGILSYVLLYVDDMLLVE